MLAPTTPAGEEDDKNRWDHYCQTSTIFKDKTVKVNIIFTIAVIMFIILALVILKVIVISIITDHNDERIYQVQRVRPRLYTFTAIPKVRNIFLHEMED